MGGSSASKYGIRPGQNMVSGARRNIPELRLEIWQAHCSGRDACHHVFVEQGADVYVSLYLYL